MKNKVETEVKAEIEKVLIEIETLAKRARFENPSIKQIDAIGREVAAAGARLKDLSYELSLNELVRS